MLSSDLREEQHCFGEGHWNAMYRWGRIALWDWSLNTFKMVILPKLTYRLKTIHVKNPASFFFFFLCRNRLILTFIWKCKSSRRAKTVLKKDIVKRLTLSNFKMYWKTTEIKTVLYWDKYRHLDQWNSIESPEINPFMVNLFSTKMPRQFNREGIVFSTNSAGTIAYPHVKRVKHFWMDLNPFLTLYTKN